MQEVFQQGVPDQPGLLLKHLGGTDISVEIDAHESRLEEERAAKRQKTRDVWAQVLETNVSNMDEPAKARKARKQVLRQSKCSEDYTVWMWNQRKEKEGDDKW